MEYLDIYDENKVFTGRKIAREESAKIGKGEYYLYVQCWIINSKGEILLTKRSQGRLHEGWWEPTGGCVTAGEDSITGIIRELEEEIGVKVDKKELNFITTKKETKAVRSCFRDIYYIRKDIKIDELKFDPIEVCEAKWVSIEEFNKISNSNEMSPSLKFFTKEYDKIINKKS